MSPNPTNFAALTQPMTERGVPVIPVLPREKRCTLSGWQNLATTNVPEPWAESFSDYNYGCVANDRVCILDCDTPDLVERIERETGQKMPETFKVLSASKRAPHLYFRHTDASRALGNRANGVFDFKANRSYVVGPGSAVQCHDGEVRTYDVVCDAPFAEIPGWLVRWIDNNSHSPKQRPAEVRAVSEKFDIDRFLAHYELTAHQKGDWYITDVCPVARRRHSQSTTTGFYFDGEHLGFKCFAGSCIGSSMTVGQVIRHMNKGDGLHAVAPYTGEIWPSAPTSLFALPKLEEALEDFNEQYCYINENHSIVQLSNRMVMRAMDFRGAHASNRFAMKTETKENGATSVVKVPVPKAWLEWPGRRQVERMVYEPGRPEFFDNQLNRWRGWGCEPATGDTSPWETLLDSIFRGDKVARRWFEQWCAYPIQNPGAKMSSAVILWGALQGTGKTTVGETMGRIYGSNFSVIREEQLHAPFNDWAADRQFILADEITGTGDKRTHADRLKLMVTGSTVRVNKKFEPEYTLRDSINYLFTSNHCNSFFLEDTDRRYFVWEVAGPALSLEFFRKYYRWLDSGGAEALFHRLLNLDLADFHPYQKPPMTEAKQEMIELGWSELDRWVREVLADPSKLVAKGGHVWSCTDLVRQYETSTMGATKVGHKGMAAALKRAGLPGHRLRHKASGLDTLCFPLSLEWAGRSKEEWVTEYVAHRPDPVQTEF